MPEPHHDPVAVAAADAYVAAWRSPNGAAVGAAVAAGVREALRLAGMDVPDPGGPQLPERPQGVERATG